MSETNLVNKSKKPLTREVGEHISFSAHFDAEKTKDLGEGMLEATISTNAIDHHGEVINMDGVDTSQYHGTVLYGHDYEGLPIGKTTNLKKFKNKITARFQLAVKEYPFAQTVYDLIKGGYLTDVSIGGLVAKWSDDYRTIEEMVMKEFSVVPIGANSDAIITAKSLGKSIDDLRNEYEDYARKVLVDKFKSMPDHEIRDAIKVLRILMARLEDTISESDLKDENQKTIKHFVLKDARAVVEQAQRTVKIIKLK